MSRPTQRNEEHRLEPKKRSTRILVPVIIFTAVSGSLAASQTLAAEDAIVFTSFTMSM
jgi:hypothetical protein